MGESVSEHSDIITNPTENGTYVDLWHEVYGQYRFFRKKWSAFIRKKLKKEFIEILYVTVEKPPFDFILSMQRQYPDKLIKLVVPLIKSVKDIEKPLFSFDYFLQNSEHSAEVFRLPSKSDNIQIYGIYTDVFDELTNYTSIYKFKYLIHFVKAVRKTAQKLKPDVIHADSIPLLLGLEYNKRWNTGYFVKYVQAFHDFYMYEELEPFWAAINLVNKKEMKRICRDNIIKKNIALLFNIQNTKNFTKMRECLNDFYMNYELYREKVGFKDNVNENIILNRLNERIIKLFPNSVSKKERMYNLMYYSLKKANKRCINNLQDCVPNIFSTLKDFCYLRKEFDTTDSWKIIHDFNKENFRDVRPLNKRFLIKELSEKRIETKFISPNLFCSNEVIIHGYLDSFYKNVPLIFLSINNSTKDEELKTSSLAILSLFQKHKNFHVIYNFPHDYKSKYLNSLIEFLESQYSLKGKWVTIEGEINQSQFLSSADMVLLSSSKNFYIENILYMSLKNGCIPVTTSEGSCKDIVVDIFDDMNYGCGFKSKNETQTQSNNEEDADNYKFNEVVEKAVDFYMNNSSGWNILVKNALNYNNNWNFELIEEYNNIYDDII